jgi:hypothetical protein
MAIIYSYPETLELLPTDMLIGTSTIRVAGKKKNITKNFTLELLKNFILDGNVGVQWGTITGILSNQTDLQAALNAKQNNITLTTTGSTGPATLVGSTLNVPDYSAGINIPTLNQVLTEGNISLLDAKIGSLYLYDSTEFDYGYLSLNDSDFKFYDTFGPSVTITRNAISLIGGIGGFNGTLSLPVITADRTYTLPNATGTIALTSDIPVVTIPNLNQVLTAGNTSLLDLKAGNLYSYDNLNMDYGIVQFYDGSVSLKAATTNNLLFYNDATGTVSFSNGTYLPTLNFAGVGNNVYTFQNANGTLAFTSDIPSLAGYVPTSRTLTINGTSYDLTADRSWSVGTVTSVGLSMPSAFTVSSSPVTGSGTIAVAGAGVASQYIRGDGTLATFPTSTGGGSSITYYLNGSVSQGTIGGVAYKEMNSVPVIGAGTDFTINADGYIAQFITDVGDPNKLLIPAGNWNFETYFSASSGGGSPRFYIELYKYNGTTFTLIASNSANPEFITGGTSIDLYFSALAMPATTLLATDRLAVRFYVIHSGRTITMHTENSHLCEVITTFSTGLTALNGLTSQVQYFAVGTSGTDFNISSVTDTHTFNLPTASAANRGALSSTDWTAFNNKFNLPSLTSGSVLFSNGTTIAQDNTNFFWDDTNNRLGIKRTNPLVEIDVIGSIRASSTVFTDVCQFNFLQTSGSNLLIRGSGGTSRITMFQATGNLLLQDDGIFTDSGFKLDVNGTTRLNGNTLIGSGTAIPSSKLTVESTTQGFLPPRMTTAQRNAIASPATGLIVYDNTLLSLYQFNGTAWVAVGAGGGSTKSINSVSTNTAAGSSASTDYFYFASGTINITLPTAVGNNNNYVIKNVGTDTITIDTTSSQTIDGSLTAPIKVQYLSLTLISDGANWNII